MDRKDFIKTGCSAALVLLWGGTSLGMQGCATLPVVKAEAEKGIISIPLVKFTEAPMMVVRNNSLEFDILATKKGEAYEALLMRCTHFANSLVVSGSSLTCPMHGSTFSFNGNVTQGPAEQPLQKLRTEISNDLLLIHTQV